ncbi:nucleotidyltransferase domain-containing protein [Candidatus Dependentiae bacterium]|nr:nucleotidyltransferase domain-containing protein [Candidatus Dependentiae bacterium]
MEKLFSTKERTKILNEVIFMKGIISVNRIASKLKVSKGLVSKYLNILVKESILKKVNGKYLVANSAIGRGIKILLNIKKLSIIVLKKYDFIKSAGIYGSCAKGENNEESDVDFWIIHDEVSENKLAKLSSEISTKIDKINILFLTSKKIKHLKTEDNLFYNSLVFGSIIIYGELNDLQL